MRYEVRRISVGSTLRFVFLIGGLIALLPASCAAILGVQLIQRANGTLANLRRFEITLPAVQIAGFNIDLPPVPVNLVEQLGLSQADQTVQSLSSRMPVAFALIILLVALAITLALALGSLLFVGGYNLLASYIGGLKVELREVDGLR